MPVPDYAARSHPTGQGSNGRASRPKPSEPTPRGATPPDPGAGAGSWAAPNVGHKSSNGNHCFHPKLDKAKAAQDGDCFASVKTHFEGQLLALLEGLRANIMHHTHLTINAMVTDFQWQVESVHMTYRAALEAAQEDNSRLRKLAGPPEDDSERSVFDSLTQAVDFKALGELPEETPMEQAFRRWLNDSKTAVNAPVIGETPVVRRWGALAERAEIAAKARSKPQPRLVAHVGTLGPITRDRTSTDRKTVGWMVSSQDQQSQAQDSLVYTQSMAAQILKAEEAEAEEEEREQKTTKIGLKTQQTVQLEEILKRKFAAGLAVPGVSDGCLQRFVVRPYDAKRLTWDVVGTVFLLFDAILFPLQALTPPDWPWMSVMQVVTAVYWLCDLPSHFLLGFRHRSGFVEMKPRNIRKHYFRTWFVPDVTFVTVDVLLLIVGFLGAAAGPLRIGKTLRFLRILRTLRLLRTGRVLNLIQKVEDKINHEGLLMSVKVLKLMTLLLLINHYVGCAWYFIGDSNVDEPTWVKHFHVGPDDSEFAWRYLTTLQWSLAQFTPSASPVQPKNARELVFALAVVLFGMVCFSAFVSSITSTIAQLRAFNAEQHAEEHNLRQFMLHNAVSPDLSARIWEFVRMSTSAAKKGRTPEAKAGLLKQLPLGLLAETRAEVYAPTITKHRLFEYLADINLGAFYDVCYHAMSMKTVLVNRELFIRNHRCTKMYWVVEGTLKYDTGTYPKITQEDRLFLSNYAKDRRAMTQNNFILEGNWVCEPALWVNRWVNKGSTIALSHVEAFELSAFVFAKAVMEVPEILTYRTKFVQFMKLYQWSDVSAGPEFVEVMANEAFPSQAEASPARGRATMTKSPSSTDLFRPLTTLMASISSDRRTGRSHSPGPSSGLTPQNSGMSEGHSGPSGGGFAPGVAGGFGSSQAPKAPGYELWGTRRQTS